MTIPQRHSVRRLAASLALGLTLAGAAHAHGEVGEHVETFEKHIPTYTTDVQRLSKKLDTIVTAYADDKAVGDRINAFVQQWKEVKFHAAVEGVATPLYPPIWAAISKLRTAAEEDVDTDVLRQRADGLKAALNQGLGGLKYAAKTGGSEQSAEHAHDEAHEQAAGDGKHPVEAIVAELEEAVSLYQQDKPEKANKLVQAAYLQRFEALEGELIEQDPDLVASLEEDFNGKLPTLIREGAPVIEVREQVDTMRKQLEQARKLLNKAGAENDAEVF